MNEPWRRSSVDGDNTNDIGNNGKAIASRSPGVGVQRNSARNNVVAQSKRDRNVQYALSFLRKVVPPAAGCAVMWLGIDTPMITCLSFGAGIAMGMIASY